MNITEALKKLLPEEHINEVSTAIEEMMAESEAVLKAEYDKRLTEAYEELAEQVEEAEKTAYAGYQQAYEVIADLMNRLEVQREQLENEKEQGFEEAFQKLKEEQAKNNNIEVELYEEFNNKLAQMKDFMVEKLDVFLGEQESEMYDEAKRDILSDPRILEQRVAVEKMAEVLSDYMSGNDYNAVSSKKIEEAARQIEDLKGQLRVVESRNVKLSMTNNKLNEQVQEAASLVTEAQKHERKNRAASRQNASGRGQRVASDQLIIESNNGQQATDKNQQLEEGADNNPFDELLILSGLQERD